MNLINGKIAADERCLKPWKFCWKASSLIRRLWKFRSLSLACVAGAKRGWEGGGGRKVPFPPSHVPLRVYALTHRWLFELSPIHSPVTFKIVFVSIFRLFVSPQCWKECLSLCGRSGCDVLFAFTSCLFLSGPKWIFHLVCFDKRGSGKKA